MKVPFIVFNIEILIIMEFFNNPHGEYIILCYFAYLYIY